MSEIIGDQQWCFFCRWQKKEFAKEEELIVGVIDVRLLERECQAFRDRRGGAQETAKGYACRWPVQNSTRTNTGEVGWAVRLSWSFCYPSLSRKKTGGWSRHDNSRSRNQSSSDHHRSNWNRSGWGTNRQSSSYHRSDQLTEEQRRWLLQMPSSWRRWLTRRTALLRLTV